MSAEFFRVALTLGRLERKGTEPRIDKKCLKERFGRAQNPLIGQRCLAADLTRHVVARHL